jgi:aquaporin Z
MRSSEWVAYVATQLVAAVLAALLARAVNGARTAGAFASAWKMLVVEFVVTFALAYVVLNVATARGTDGNSFTDWRSGSRSPLGRSPSAACPAGAFNPAVALGASVLGIFKWNHYWIYVVGPLLGAVIAAGAFLHTQPAEKPEGDVEAART